MIILSDEQTKEEVDLIVVGFFKRKRLMDVSSIASKCTFSMIPKFNLFVALGIRDAIQSFTNDKVEIKWPNDIYIADKKYVVLTEMIANYDSIDAIICGIGINLNHSDSDFSDDIKQRATSIRLHSNNKINRYSFLKKLISSIENDIHNFNKAFYRNSK